LPSQASGGAAAVSAIQRRLRRESRRRQSTALQKMARQCPGGTTFAFLAARSLRPSGHLRCASSSLPSSSVVSSASTQFGGKAAIPSGTSERGVSTAPFQDSTDIIMTADLEEYQFVFRLFHAEEQSEAKSGAALQDIGAKFPDSRSSRLVRLAPGFQHGHQGLVHRCSILYGKFAQFTEEPFSELNPPRGLRCFR
jgi:hypothetical protein